MIKESVDFGNQSKSREFEKSRPGFRIHKILTWSVKKHLLSYTIFLWLLRWHFFLTKTILKL